MTTILLHGFWGQPKDWNPVLQKLPLGKDVLIPDLYEPGLLQPAPLEVWGEKFWGWVDHVVGPEMIELVGYSLGGRLGLSALTRQPLRVKRALILSARPLMSLGERPARKKWEDEWAEAFRQKSWSELEVAWQEQSVFADSGTLERRHREDLRESLAQSLTEWSPRRHAFGEPELRQLPETVAYAFGAMDKNYLNVAKTLQDLPVKGQISILPNAGHRLVQDAAEFIGKWMEQG